MIDGIIRINETDPPTTVTLTPTVPIMCPPCVVTVHFVKYIGLKLSRCSVSFSVDDPIMGSKTITIKAIPTPGSFSRVARIIFSEVVLMFPGSPWEGYTPVHCPVCFLLYLRHISVVMKIKQHACFFQPKRSLQIVSTFFSQLT